MLKYDLYICHSDGTWTNGHFIEIDDSMVYDKGCDQEAINRFIEEHPDYDMVHVGVDFVTEIE